MDKFLCIIVFMFATITATAQLQYDSTITMNRKNIIRYNPVPSGLLGLNTFVLGYERVFAPHQSVSLNVGLLSISKQLDLSKLEGYGVNSERKSGGFSIVLDYRRYFKKRNRSFAPDGLYWGPFFTLYKYQHELGLTYTDPANLSNSSFKFTSDFSAYHIGVQLGYQFVIAKRLCIDLIFIGPSYGRYQADLNVSTDVKLDKESDIYKAYYDLIVERLPGLETLLKDQSISASGNFSTNNLGYRYVFQIGFLF